MVRKGSSGFTIVELLIVIVVIAILAVITVVAYTGIQTSANNSSTIAKASQFAKLIEAYRAANAGAAPFSGSNVCMTKDNLCTAADGTPITVSNGTIVANLSTVGTVPDTTTASASGRYGIRYNNWAVRTFNGAPASLQITYYLIGNAVNCGLANVRAVDGMNSDTSTTGYTSTDGNFTMCVVSFYD